MEIIVYNSEKFERTQRRYVVFTTFFASLIVLSIVYQNYQWAVLLFFLIWWYLFFSISNLQLISFIIEKDYLQIWNKAHPRSKINWFAIEVDADNQQKIKNIILVIQWTNHIHTFNDEDNKIKNFIVQISEYIPMLANIQQSNFELLLRKMKI